MVGDLVVAELARQPHRIELVVEPTAECIGAPEVRVVVSITLQSQLGEEANFVFGRAPNQHWRRIVAQEQWDAIPSEFGSRSTCYRRFVESTGREEAALQDRSTASL